MFTGIITDIGTIRSREDRGDTRLVIGTRYDVDGIELGASIACSGACLTVVDKGVDADGHWFAIDASGETLARTAAGMWDAGRRLNLERALKIGDELGGHIVTGHVDAVGTIVSVIPVGDSVGVTVEAPAELAPHIAAKGSITVDGISLTVSGLGADWFEVSLIPETLSATTLGALAPGDRVNIETDILARHVARMRELEEKK